MAASIQNWLWVIVVLFVTIIPTITGWVKAWRFNYLISQIEKKRGTKVITMIHRQPSGFLAALSQRYIQLEDSEAIMQVIRQAGDKPIDLVMHTPGGLVIAAEQIARVLQAHKAGVTAIVPQYALSGGTLLCLAADQILMDQHAMLGPIDPQINNFPASAYLRVLREKEHGAVQDDTIMYAHMAERANVQLQQMAFNLLRKRMDDEKAMQVATMLTEGRWTHDYPLHVEALQELGLPVSTAMPQEFWSLFELSNPTQTKAMRKVDEKKGARA